MALRNGWLQACLNQEPQAKPEASKPPVQESSNLPSQEPVFIDEPSNTGDAKPNTQEHETGKLPTLEEYVAAGYKAENYERFVARFNAKGSLDLFDSLDGDTGDFTPSEGQGSPSEGQGSSGEPPPCKS